MSEAPFDDDAWDALGSEPFADELPDAALIASALSDATVAAIASPPSTRRPWVIPMVVAAGLLAAAVVMFVLVPHSLLGFEHATDTGSLAADVQDDARDDTAAHERRGPPASTPASHPIEDVPTTGPERSPPAAGHAEPAVADEASSATAEPPRRGARRPIETADDLLRSAQEHLADGDAKRALSAYRVLARRYPRSDEAHAAMVSIGRLLLDAGRARNALARFDAYLARSGGSLRQEARYGRIRALRKLGRDEAELAAIEAFERDFPRSLYAERIRARAEELR